MWPTFFLVLGGVALLVSLAASAWYLLLQPDPTDHQRQLGRGFLFAAIGGLVFSPTQYAIQLQLRHNDRASDQRARAADRADRLAEDRRAERSALLLQVTGKRDLQGIDLHRAKLANSYLRGKDLEDADLHGADLRKANLEQADLRRANLRGADLRGALLTAADLRGAVLKGTRLDRTHLTRARFSALGTTFPKPSFAGARFNHNDFRRADLYGVDFAGARFESVDLSGASLRDADLRGAAFVFTNGAGAQLCGADLRKAILDGADFREAILWDADLRGALLLDNAILWHADLRRADLRGVHLTDHYATTFAGGHYQVAISGYGAVNAYASLYDRATRGASALKPVGIARYWPAPRNGGCDAQGDTRPLLSSPSEVITTRLTTGRSQTITYGKDYAYAAQPRPLPVQPYR